MRSFIQRPPNCLVDACCLLLSVSNSMDHEHDQRLLARSNTFNQPWYVKRREPPYCIKLLHHKVISTSTWTHIAEPYSRIISIVFLMLLLFISIRYVLLRDGSSLSICARLNWCIQLYSCNVRIEMYATWSISKETTNRLARSIPHICNSLSQSPTGHGVTGLFGLLATARIAWFLPCQVLPVLPGWERAAVDQLIKRNPTLNKGVTLAGSECKKSTWFKDT